VVSLPQMEACLPFWMNLVKYCGFSRDEPAKYFRKRNIY
jgi:hypothetical protein